MDRGPADWLTVRTTCSRWSGLGFATPGGWNGWAAGPLQGVSKSTFFFWVDARETWKVLGLGSILFREISNCTLESEDTSETEGSEPSNTLWGLSAWGSCGLRRKARSCAKKWLSKCNRWGKEKRHGILRSVQDLHVRCSTMYHCIFPGIILLPQKNGPNTDESIPKNPTSDVDVSWTGHRRMKLMSVARLCKLSRWASLQFKGILAA